jgi:hypothetical protein
MLTVQACPLLLRRQKRAMHQTKPLHMSLQQHSIQVAHMHKLDQERACSPFRPVPCYWAGSRCTLLSLQQRQQQQDGQIARMSAQDERPKGFLVLRSGPGMCDGVEMLPCIP